MPNMQYANTVLNYKQRRAAGHYRCRLQPRFLRQVVGVGLMVLAPKVTLAAEPTSSMDTTADAARVLPQLATVTTDTGDFAPVPGASHTTPIRSGV